MQYRQGLFIYFPAVSVQTDIDSLILQAVGHLIKKTFGVIPAQTWIGDGFAVAVLADLLAARFDIALNHDAFDEIADIIRMAAAVEYLFYNPDLLLIELVGVGVVGIHDAGRILQIAFQVKLEKQL